jgi:hypothetical protein
MANSGRLGSYTSGGLGGDTVLVMQNNPVYIPSRSASSTASPAYPGAATKAGKASPVFNSNQYSPHHPHALSGRNPLPTALSALGSLILGISMPVRPSFSPHTSGLIDEREREERERGDEEKEGKELIAMLFKDFNHPEINDEADIDGREMNTGIFSHVGGDGPFTSSSPSSLPSTIVCRFPQWQLVSCYT